MSGITDGVIVKGRGPAVVCLHSTLNNAKQWQSLIDLLADKFTVIAIDLYNYGNAPKFIPSDSQPYNLVAEIARISAIVDRYVGAEKFHLVGHSFGGAVSLKYAQQVASQLLSLSLYEPVAFHFQLNDVEKKAAVDQLSQMLCSEDALAGCQFFIDFCNGKGAFQQLPVPVQQKLVQGLELVKLNHFALLEERYTLEVLSGINCSKLLMYGSQSHQLIIDLMHEMIAADSAIKHCEFNAGHMAPLTHAIEINAEIERHLTSFNS